MSLIRKKCAAVLAAIAFSLCFAASASAVDCASAKIMRVGVNPVTGTGGASNYMVQLDCADTPAAWHGVLTLYLSADLGDSGLATLLTAYSLGKTVWVRTAGIASGSIVNIIYVND